ncbi:MAG: D-Ala-D-Ala carboxypeptidase family metallohydrolase, partial [Pseudomonadota bacterium]
DRAKALVSEIVPGATFTSGYRTPAHNAEVGGAQNSFHTRGDGQAWDFVPPQGADMEKFRAELQARGAPVSELLNEGDHWHWAFGQGQEQGQAAPVDYAQLAASASGQPPAAPPPAGGAAATPAASVPQAAAGVATMGPTPQQRALAQQLLNDPRTYDQGVAYVMKLRQQMAEAVKWENTTINGLPFQVNPYTGERRPITLPPEAMTQVQTAQQAGVATAPPGTYLQRDPLGNLKDVPGGTPPQGYGVRGDGYAPIRGGPADPRREQPPATGYQYQGGGQQPIPGGPADPANPQAVLQGTETIRKELAPILDTAQKLRRSYESVRVGYQQQNGAGDIAMINGLQRMIDEGVVREGDVALQLKGQGLAGSISGLRGYLSSEGFFADPVVRQKVMAVANSLYNELNSGYRARVEGFKPIVEGWYGPGSFDRYVFTPEMAKAVGWTGAPGPQAGGEPDAPPQFKPGSADAGLALAIQRGLFNRLSPAQQKRARDLGLVK